MYRGVTLILALIVVAGGTGFWWQTANRPPAPAAVSESEPSQAVGAVSQTTDVATEPSAEADEAFVSVGEGEGETSDTAAVPTSETSEGSAESTLGADDETADLDQTEATTDTASAEQAGDESDVASETVSEQPTDELAAVDNSVNSVSETDAQAQQQAEQVAAAESEPSASGADDAEQTGELSVPTLDIVRIEPTGETLIAGNATPSSRIGLIYNGRVIAETLADAVGDFVLVPNSPLPEGDGSVQIGVLDDAGAPAMMAEQDVAVVIPGEDSLEGFLVGLLRPGEPIEIIEREAPAQEQETQDAPPLAATDDASEVVAETEVSAAQDAASTAEAQTEVGASEDVALSDDAAADDAVESADRVVPEASDEAVETASAPSAEPLTDDVESAPAQPDVGPAPPTVVVDAIELEGQRIWIAGSAEPETVIRLYQDNALLGETIAGPQGRYLYEGVLSEAEGTVTIRADALAEGSADVIARAIVPFRMPLNRAAREDVATADPVQPAEPAGSDAPVAAQTAEASAPAVAPDAAQSEVSTAASAAEPSTTASQPTPAPVESAETAAQEGVAGTDVEAGTDPEATLGAETAVAAQPSAEPVAALVPQPSGRVSVLDTGRVIIRRGDNLWTISRRVFGQGIRYTSIYDANRGQIEDPAVIFPGQVFELPQPDQEWGEVPGIDALDPEQRAPTPSDN